MDDFAGTTLAISRWRAAITLKYRQLIASGQGAVPIH
jgi:hypothetical protein